jgi:predicted phosphodiesterase
MQQANYSNHMPSPQPINASPFTRIGLIGDVHAEDDALLSSLDFLKNQQLDAILCTGDIADGLGDINRCCELLQQHNVITVRGNHDRWLLNDKVRHIEKAHSRTELTPQNQAYLTALPTSLTFATSLGHAMLCHGVVDDDLAKVWPGSERMPPERSATLDELLASNQYHLLLNGHMHYRTLVYFEQLTLLNAGTLHNRHRPGFSTLDFAQNQVTAYEFGEQRCEVVREFNLQPHAQDRVWTNSAAFDGQWTPKVLYAST